MGDPKQEDDSSKENNQREVGEQIQHVLQKATVEKTTGNDTIFAVLIGAAGAVLGALVWYFVAKIFNVQIGYLAVGSSLFIVGKRV